MNCKILIISASNLLCHSNTSLFCKVYQSIFANFVIGETNVYLGKSTFEWNESFECHLIRGTDFTFDIIEINNEIQHIIGKAKLNIFNILFSQEINLPIEINESVNNSISTRPTLKIKIDQLIKLK